MPTTSSDAWKRNAIIVALALLKILGAVSYACITVLTWIARALGAIAELLHEKASAWLAVRGNAQMLQRRLLIAVFMALATVPLWLLSGATIKGYGKWLGQHYNADKQYVEVYRERTEEDHVSPLAANTDAGCSAALPGCGGALLILGLIMGGGEWLAYLLADQAWKKRWLS